MSSDAIRVVERAIEGEQLSASTEAEPPRFRMELFKEVRVALKARLGEAPMTVESLMALKVGSTVCLDTGLADHVDLMLNDTLIAHGEIVAVGGKYGVRITEILPPS